MKKDYLAGFLRAGVLASIGAVLLRAFYLHRFSYFWLDDFNNFYLAQRTGGWAMLWQNLNPASTSYRPTGMLVYWIHWRLFDLSPLPYHLSLWVLHSCNVALVYLLLKKLTDSRYGAAFGAMLFAFQAVYWDIFWDFGTIFELLSALLFFIGLMVYIHRSNSLRWILFASVVYVFAIKAKEMAITLPAVWVLYDITVGNPSPFALMARSGMSLRNRIIPLLDSIKKLSIPAAVAAWFISFKSFTMAGNNPSSPYYLDFSVQTLGQGYGWYFDALSNGHLPWGIWIGISVLAAALFLYQRNHLALFFLGYVLATLLPVLPLRNHRFAFYWYIPFGGVCGLAALVVKRISVCATNYILPHFATAIGMLVFVTASYLNLSLQEKRGYWPRMWARDISQEYQNFILGLRALPAPALRETIYYESTPRYFDETTILSATQVAFRRTDLRARIVKEVPLHGRYRVRFENPTVFLEREQNTGGAEP